MAWIIVGLVFVVAAVTWLVARGTFGEQPELVDDRIAPAMPEGEWTAADVAALRFASVPRGYHREQVDQLLHRVQVSLGSTATAIAPATAAEVGNSRFEMVRFGYSPQQVDVVLDRLSRQLFQAEQGGPVSGEAL